MPTTTSDCTTSGSAAHVSTPASSLVLLVPLTLGAHGKVCGNLFVCVCVCVAVAVWLSFTVDKKPDLTCATESGFSLGIADHYAAMTGGT